jgi:putative mRNA 3-end processing factor
LYKVQLITFTSKGIYCIPGNFYIDPWQPVDYAVITHAHSDHARHGSRFYLCHHCTRPVLQYRLGADIHVESAGYGQELVINGVKVSLHPAGHIIGSAQVRMEYQGYVSVVSGDYKTQDDGISTPFELVKCHEFVTESTFGLPIYNWLSNHDICEEMQRWVQHNQSLNKTSVFVGYPLGKAQRLMKALEGMAAMYVHYSVANTNEAIKASGIELPDASVLHLEEDRKKLQNSVVIVPPSVFGTSIIKKIPNAAVAICSGWMQVRGNRRWKAADAGFAISDHADWNGLIDTVKATGACRIHVTHGSVAVFTRYLNELGLEAHEVKTKYGEENEDPVTENNLEQEMS